MGFFSEIKKLTRPYDDEEDEEFEDYAPRTPERVPVTPRTAAPQRFFTSDTQSQERRDNKVVNIHATTQLQVVVVKPENFQAASDIADHLRAKRTVVLNLEAARAKSKEESRRLLDFLSGVCYAQDGKIKKVAIDTFLLTPYDVNLMGDLLDELENNGVFVNS